MDTITISTSTFKTLLEDSAILGQVVNAVDHCKEPDGVKKLADDVKGIITNYKVLRSLK